MEKSFESPSEHALDLALDTLNKLSKGEAPTSTILRSCYAIASLLGDTDNKDWINKELKGYDDKKGIPSYRQLIHKIIGEVNIEDSVHRLEHVVRFKQDVKIFIDKKFDQSFSLTPDWSYTILSHIKDRCLIFLIDSITKLQYSGKMGSLVSDTQKQVNEKITKINPEIDSEIQSISINIIGEDPEKLSKVALSCRRILKLLADKVWPASDEEFIDSSGKKHPVKDDDFMNRLLAFLEKNKGDKLIKNEINYLAAIFDEIRESTGKGVHAKISKFEAERIFIHTYMIISEVLRYYKLD